MESGFEHPKKLEDLQLIEKIFTKEEADVQNEEDLFSETDVLEDTTQYVNFQVGPEYYAVDIMNVLEIVKVPKISFLPSAGSYILGLINLRGNIVPVVNTHKLFDMNPVDTTEASRIIILNVDRSTLGLMVDSVSQVIELRQEDIDEPMVTLEVERTEYITGETNLDGQLVAILDIRKLIANSIFAHA
jgi:purine-binding chemotaxis protein CheW